MIYSSKSLYAFLRYSLAFLAISSIFLITACSHSIYDSAETIDDRNAFVEHPLEVPQVNAQVLSYNNNEIVNNYKTIAISKIIFGKDYNSNIIAADIGMTADDRQLLKNANAEKDYHNIRNKLDKSYLAIISKNDNFIRQVLNLVNDESIKNPQKQYFKLN